MIYDIYIQMAFMELGFYITFWHMTNVKKNCRVIFVLSYFFFLCFDFAVLYGYRWIETEDAYLFSILHTIAMMLSFIVYLLVCEDNFWKICTAIAVSDLLGGAPHMLAAYSVEGNVDALQLYFFPELTYIPYGVVLGGVYFLALFLLFRKYLVYFFREPMEKKLWVRVLATIYTVNAMFHIVGNMPEAVVLKQNWTIGLGLILVLFVTLLVLSYRDYKQKLQQEQYHLRRQNKMVQDHYEALENQITLSRRFRKEVTEVFADMESQGLKNVSGNVSKNIKEPVWSGTGKDLLDQVLVNKISGCKECGITAHFNIGSTKNRENADGINLGRISEMDIVILLYNLLDNAIESCMKIEDISKRWIRLYIGNEDEKLIIRCENAREGQAVLAKGHRTWKRDKKLHGTGMEIMKDIVKKYHGVMQYEEGKEEFQTKIVLRNSEEKHG